MAGFQGMDPAVMRTVGQRLRAQATQLDAVLTSVQRSVDEAVTLWDGDDAHGFNNWWASHYRPALASAYTAVAEMAATIERNVTEQEAASGSGGSAGGGRRGDGARPVGAGDFLGPLWPAGAVGFGGDLVELEWGKNVNDLPGGAYLGGVIKGIGLGSAGVDLADSLQHRDYSGAGLALGDGVMTFAQAGPAVLWTGLSEEIFFFIPRGHAEQDELMAWLQQERGLTPDQIGERYTGLQGFVNLGNDNAARKAPWLVDGADKLLEKPAEWLYNAGIKL